MNNTEFTKKFLIIIIVYVGYNQWIRTYFVLVKFREYSYIFVQVLIVTCKKTIKTNNWFFSSLVLFFDEIIVEIWRLDENFSWRTSSVVACAVVHSAPDCKESLQTRPWTFEGNFITNEELSLSINQIVSGANYSQKHQWSWPALNPKLAIMVMVIVTCWMRQKKINQPSREYVCDFELIIKFDKNKEFSQFLPQIFVFLFFCSRNVWNLLNNRNEIINFFLMR